MLLSSETLTTDQDSSLLQEAHLDTLDINVHLIQERYSPVTPTSNVLPPHHQGSQGALQIVVLSQDVGVRSLEVMGEPIKCSVVRVARDATLVKL